LLTPDVTAFVRAALPPAPARVLEVGAGDGELAVMLAQAGYDVVAIDPASSSADVRPVTLHELEEPLASFDAAVAVVSLHHVQPLEESCRRLAEVVRPGGMLAVDEIDVERLDERAAHWWLGHSGHAATPGEVVAGMREHLHSLARLREALGEWFAVGEPVRGAYMHRWNVPPGLREEEEQLIAAGELPAFGARLVGVRRP
jgi:SAM-dependent methyltransferase